MISTENGSAERSLTNFVILERQHGKLVGIIHRIFDDGSQSPMLFFRDGHVHEATGLASGEGEKAEIFTEILSQVCGGHAYVCAVPFMGSEHDKFFEKAKREKTSIYYCFPPIGPLKCAVENSDGLTDYNAYYERIFTEDLGESVSMDEAL